MHRAIHRVGVDIEGFDAHGVGVHKERVLLRVVLDQRVLCGEAHACMLVVNHLATGQGVLVLVVDKHHVAQATVIAALAVII